MENMFSNCISLKSLDLNNFDTKNVQHMKYMLYNCSSLVSLDLSMFNTENVSDFDYMFSYDDDLVNLDMSSFNTLNSKTFENLFESCYSLTVTLNRGKCQNIISSIPDYVSIRYIDNRISSLFQ